MSQRPESEDYFGPDNRYVVELSPSDFDEKAPWVLKPKARSSTAEQSPSPKMGSGMVLFYAPWCGFCKAVKEPWLEAAKVAGFCDFYAFNCEKNRGHLDKIKTDMPELVRGYPTIILYKDGQPGDYYEGERTKQAFIDTCMRVCGKGRCKVYTNPKPAGNTRAIKPKPKANANSSNTRGWEKRV